jgi:hypothetical protein
VTKGGLFSAARVQLGCSIEGRLRIYRYTNVAFTLIAAFVSSVALAQCHPDEVGATAGCPVFTAPATSVYFWGKHALGPLQTQPRAAL